MAKKNLASLMSGIMGEPKHTEESQETVSVQEHDIEQLPTEKVDEMQENLEAKRYRNVGRPKKGTTNAKKEEIRATLIVNPELLRKLKYISLVEGSLLKDLLDVALTNYIEGWESENGKIRLPKKK